MLALRSFCRALCWEQHATCPLSRFLSLTSEHRFSVYGKEVPSLLNRGPLLHHPSPAHPSPCFLFLREKMLLAISGVRKLVLDSMCPPFRFHSLVWFAFLLLTIFCLLFAPPPHFLDSGRWWGLGSHKLSGLIL